MTKRLALLVVTFIVLSIPLGIFGLIRTDSGSEWLLRRIFLILPAQVSVATIDGRLLDRVSITGFHYQSDAEIIAIDKLALAWQPYQLLLGTLKIADVVVDGLSISLLDAKQPQAESSFDLNAEWLLPVKVVIDTILLTNIHYQQADFLQKIQAVQLSLTTEQDQLKIMSLAINAQPIAVKLKGDVTLGKGFPFSLTSAWQFTDEQMGLLQGTTTISGDINKLAFENHLASPFKVNVKGYLDDLQTIPRVNAQADWHDFVWPFSGSMPQIKSEQGAIELIGLLDSYHLTLNGQLTQQYLPEASLSFKGKGSLTDFSIEKLILSSKIGLFQIAGDVSWLKSPIFDLTATGQNLNPAILLPEIPGNLTFTGHLKGKLDAKAMQLDAEIKKLSGTVRDKPVSANGKLALNDDQLKIDGLQISSGVNSILVNGALGQEQAALKVFIDTPTLDVFWPTLGGSLKGEGFVQGTWKNPIVKFQLQGKRLRFADYSAKQLALDIDYSPEPNKQSKLLLSASSFKSVGMQMHSVRLDGLGTLLEHSFKGDVNYVDGDLSFALTGKFKAGNWAGDLSKIDINALKIGMWQLKKNWSVNIIDLASGIDATFSEACLVQKNAAICTYGHYLANGDFNVALKSNNLPVSLINSYLPEQTQLEGIINADAELQKQRGLLAGGYQLELSPSSFLFKGKDVLLGASSLSGKLKGEIVTADINVALASHNYLRSQMRIDTGKSKAINGHITASLNELVLLEAFVPHLSSITSIKGLLTADLDLKGLVSKPTVIGEINLTNAAVDIGEAGFGLRDINLHAVASGGQANPIHVSGTLLPVLRNSPNATQQLQLNGLVTIKANLQKLEGVLDGDYRIDSPPLTLLFQHTDITAKIPLAASFLSGSIKGDKISSNLDLGLVRQDFLRAQLEMNLGKMPTLSGHLNTSVVEFETLNPLLPELSNIKGRLNAELALQGSFEKPIINGDIHLTGGTVDVNQLGLALREIKFQAMALNSDRLQITGSAKSGAGRLNLDGVVGLHAEERWPVELTMKGENFEVAKLPEAQIALTPDLKFLSADGKGKITGTIKVPKALMMLAEIPENAVKVSRDEIVLGQKEPENNTLTAPDIDAVIDVELGKEVKFSGQGLTTDLIGKLKINKSADKITMHGNIDMIKARYKSYGQDLTVRKGRFVFNGPIENPWLDVEAIRVSKNKKVTAILALTGSLEKPQTHISSEPGLPESEALAYLIAGRPLSQVSQSEGNMLASAAISYGAGQASWITNKLGVDVFEVQEGETLKDTLLAMGQYLTPNFYVGAKVGMFNKQASMVLKHKITESINVETQAGTSQRVKINYEIDRD
jgi:translocation and assembly module TamB